MKEIRALIVDDSSVMRKIVERSLRQAGILLSQVLEASNGAEGLAIIEKEKVDLILSDINMPIMDGLEFVKQLTQKQTAPPIPVVMITTEGAESHVIRALESGARGYIRKPFTAEAVKVALLPVSVSVMVNVSVAAIVLAVVRLPVAPTQLLGSVVPPPPPKTWVPL